MKKLLALTLSLLLLVSMAACSGNAATSSGSAGAPGSASEATEASAGAEASQTDAGTTERTPTMTVGFMLPTLQSEFFVYYSNGVKEALEAQGYTVTISSYDAESSKAIEIIENYIIADMDLIIAMVLDGAADSALKKAMDKGIRVLVSGVETEFYDVCLVADNAEIGGMIGEMAAAFVNEKLGGEAEVIALIANASNADMQKRANSMVEKFAELCPGATIVGTPEYVDVGDGTTGVENMLQQYPDAKVILCYGDQGAIEGVQVLKAAGKTGDEYAAFGCDATEQGLKMIADGDIFRGTVDMGDIVAQTADASLALLANELETPYRWSGSNIMVTSENISDYVS